MKIEIIKDILIDYYTSIRADAEDIKIKFNEIRVMFWNKQIMVDFYILKDNEIVQCLLYHISFKKYFEHFTKHEKEELKKEKELWNQRNIKQ